MLKFLTDFLFGLAFGFGLLVAYGVARLIIMLLSHAGNLQIAP